MNIPTVLITSTINEFKAEGYTTETLNVNTGRAGDKEVQYVTLSFKKEDSDNG